MFTIIRRADYLPEDNALTELRRANSVPAARRIAHEVAYRFFEGAEALGRVSTVQTMQDILRWDGSRNIHVTLGGASFLLMAH